MKENMIIIRRPTKKEKLYIPNITKHTWFVEDTKHGCIDLCDSFWKAIKYWLHYHGFKTLK